MPIEVQIEKTHGKNLPAARDAAPVPRVRDRADRAAEGATSSASACSATGTIRTRRWPSATRPTRSARSARCSSKGYLYRGLKPVNWCFDCSSALAEAEVEYEDRVDTADRRRLPARRSGERAKLAHGVRPRRRCPKGRSYAVIWTTTPWTIPANQALNVHPEFDYALVETPRGHADPRAGPGRGAASTRFGLEGHVIATATGRRARAHRVPPSVLRPRVAGVPRRLRDARAGTGIVHSVARVRRRGLPVVPPLRHDGRRHPQARCRATAATPTSLPFFGGLKIWEANPKIVDKLREVGALLHAEKYTHSYMHCWRHKTPIIYRATTQWFAGMDDVPGYRRHQARGAAARDRAARHRGDAVLSGVGQGAPVRHDRQPARLDAVAPAPVGRAAAVLRRPRDRRAASRHAGAARARRDARSRRAASRRGSRRRYEDFGVDPSASTASSPTRSTCGSTRARRTRR